MRPQRSRSPQEVEVDVRDPATALDPVGLVTRHLDADARVTVRDSQGRIPTFALVRRGSSVTVLDGEGASVAAYADARAAMRHGLTRWPPDLVAAADAAVGAAIRSARHAA